MQTQIYIVISSHKRQVYKKRRTCQAELQCRFQKLHAANTSRRKEVLSVIFLFFGEGGMGREGLSLKVYAMAVNHV